MDERDKWSLFSMAREKATGAIKRVKTGRGSGEEHQLNQSPAS